MHEADKKKFATCFFSHFIFERIDLYAEFSIKTRRSASDWG